MDERDGRTIDLERLGRDAGYRREQARTLLASAGDVDHVELRRVAQRIFPHLAKPRAAGELAQLIGAAATMQRTIEITAITEQREAERRHEEDTLDPPLKIEYPERYADLDDARKNLLIRFCAEQVEEEAEGRDALSLLKARHGWPYSDRTFYVGPWKAARLRRRKRRRRDEARDNGHSRAAADRMDASEPDDSTVRQPALDDGDVLLTTDRARYQARKLDDGDWEVRVRARLDPDQMQRLHAEAIELFFGSTIPVSPAMADLN